MGNQVTIDFEVSKNPENGATRIKTLYPNSLYVSAKNIKSVKYFFEREIVNLAINNKLLKTYGGEGFSLKENINWKKVLKEGKGSVTVQTVSVKETYKVMNEGVQVKDLPVDPLHSVWFENPDGDSVCIIFDDEENIDIWIKDCTEADLNRKKFSKLN